MALPRYYMYGDFFEFKDIFTERFKEKKFKKGDKLKNVGEIVKSLYYSVHGLTKVSFIHESGESKTTFISGAGVIQPLYYPSQFPVWEKRFRLEAYTSMTVLEISKEEFKALAEEYPRLMEIMLDVTARNLYTMTADAMSHIYDEGITRICNLMYAHISNLDVKHNHDINQITITQSDISAIVGLNRVNTNKILQQLKDMGIIALERRRIRIIDRKKLISYCSTDIVLGE